LIRNKISQTEKELSEVQNKLSNLQIGINQPSIKKNNLPPNFIRNSENKADPSNVKPPWATNNTYTIVLKISYLYLLDIFLE